jgi:hypothetical protein
MQVYRVPPLFRQPALLVLALSIVLDLFFLVAGLLGWSGIALGPALLFIVHSAPLLLGVPLYLLYHNSGEIILTDEAVVVRRWGREKRLRYDEVVAVRERDRNLPPNLVLRGEDVRVGIHTQVEPFAQLYERLVQRVEVMRRRAEAGFPLRLHVTVQGQVWLIVGIVLLVAFYLGVGLLPIWSELTGEAPNFSPVLLRNAAIWFALLSFVFLPAIYIVVVITVAGSLRGGQPAAYEFDEDVVRYRLPFGPWRSRPAEQLLGIHLKPVETRVRAANQGVTVAETVRHYEVVLRFAGDRVLEMSLDRIRQFGFTPTKLHARLSRLYPGVTAGELTEEGIARGPEGEARFPYTLRLKGLVLWNGLAVTSFFALCTVGTVLIPYWLILSDDPGASANGVFWICMAVFGSVFLCLTLLVFNLTLHPGQPYKLVLSAEAIRFRYIFSPWRSWPARSLQGVELQTMAVRGFRSRGSRYVPTTIRKQAVVLRFHGGRTLSIDSDRARQFGLTAPALQELFQSLYGEN